MTSPARQAEADRVELVYYWALQQLANQLYPEFIELWQEVPKTSQAATAGWWLARAVELVMRKRARARDLAIAYYRLVRALRTGYTISDPVRDEDESVSLERLRDEFEAEVDQIAADAPEIPASEQAVSDEELELPVVDPGPEPEYDDEDFEDDDSILIEEIADLDRLIEEEDRAAEEEAAIILDQLGIENMLNKLEQINREKELEAQEREANEAHEAAGRRSAAAAQRITMNAARGLNYSLADTDHRVIGWARYSRTGTPCGWCAMLISRGPVYKSRQSAQGGAEEQNKYHDNCRCIAIPIFFESQMDSELFELYRKYRDMWNSRIRGKYGGDAALTEWRRIVREDNRRMAAQAAA